MKPEYRIRIVKKGITAIPADVIVNAANEHLQHGGGVCGVIFDAAGAYELQKACNRIGHCDTGNAVITDAFRLNAKYIIHAVGPVYHDGKHGEEKLLYGAYKNSLMLAGQYACRSIVFPLISAGIFGYPKKEAWHTALKACMDFMDEHPNYRLTIYFAVIDDSIKQLGERELQKLLNSDSDDKKTAIDLEITRFERIALFADTLLHCSKQPLVSSIAKAIKNTEIYYDDDYPVFEAKEREQTVTVTKDRTFAAAKRLKEENPDAKIAVINFANGTHPGGGVHEGYSAQEESLCRCSTLYPIISAESLNSYYEHNKKAHNKAVGTDALMYTEDVIVFKTDTVMPVLMKKEEWYKVDVITMAAPDLRAKTNTKANGGGIPLSKSTQFAYHLKRAMHMLTVAASKNVDILVLGAFGCGAFENDPETVAKAYKTALEVFPKVFRKVEFAVYCKDSATNNSVFSSILK